MKLFDCLSIGFLLALSINLLIIFFLAFFNGYEWGVIVNDYGEAIFEAIVFPIWVIMGSITLIRLLR